MGVVVALHWHIRDVQQEAAAAIALTRTNVKDLAQACLAEVVHSTLLAALRMEHALTELRLRSCMTRALAVMGVEILSCRLRDVAVPPASLEDREPPTGRAAPPDR